MNVSSLIELIAKKTLSPDHDDTVILDILNRGLIDIAGGGDRQHGEALVAPLPGLFTSGTVTIQGGENSVSLPDDFQRGLKRVFIGTNKLKKCGDPLRFIDKYEGQTGEPVEYVVKGDTLYVGPTPSDDEIVKVYYYKFPKTLSYSDISIEGIPAHLQHKLLFNYACREIYSDIEQGVEGASPDTSKHDLLYKLALTDLERVVGAEEGDAVNVCDDFFSDDTIIF